MVFFILLRYKRVPMMSSLPQNKLVRIADLLEEETYQENDYIVREGEIGTTFFIVKSGQVAITHRQRDAESPAISDPRKSAVRILAEGDFFGEQALLKYY